MILKERDNLKDEKKELTELSEIEREQVKDKEENDKKKSYPLSVENENIEQKENSEEGGNIKLTRKQNMIQTLKFVAFSISAGVIQLVSFSLLNEMLHIDYWVSYLTALTLSVLYNFTINRHFTFKSANNVPIAMLKVIGYYAVFTPLSTIAGDALTVAGWNEYLVLFLTMVLNMVTEFIFCRLCVYKKSMNTNKLAQKQKEKEKNKNQI